MTMEPLMKQGRPDVTKENHASLVLVPFNTVNADPQNFDESDLTTEHAYKFHKFSELLCQSYARLCFCFVKLCKHTKLTYGCVLTTSLVLLPYTASL